MCLCMPHTQVQLLDTAALQATEPQAVPPGTRVEVSGRLAMAANGQLFVQATQLQLIMDQQVASSSTQGAALLSVMDVWDQQFLCWPYTGTGTSVRYVY